MLCCYNPCFLYNNTLSSTIHLGETMIISTATEATGAWSIVFKYQDVCHGRSANPYTSTVTQLETQRWGVRQLSTDTYTSSISKTVQPLQNDRLLAILLDIIDILNLDSLHTQTGQCTQKVSAWPSAATTSGKLIPSSHFELVVKVYRTESTIWFITTFVTVMNVY
jgi:hypothetical protein